MESRPSRLLHLTRSVSLRVTGRPAILAGSLNPADHSADCPFPNKLTRDCSSVKKEHVYDIGKIRGVDKFIGDVCFCPKADVRQMSTLIAISSLTCAVY